jgi:CRISPR/Cas system-associated exonuclease Cas4 (RecB family)
VFVTWLAKTLAGSPCLYSPWFRAHYQYARFEEQASDLVGWNRQHTALMAAIQQELEEVGWTCTVEEENAFKLQGRTAVLAGKPDLIGRLEAYADHPARVLVVDGKTGQPRDSDIWQVLIYLWALQRARSDLMGALEGEVRYAHGSSVSVTDADLTPDKVHAIVAAIAVIAGERPPAKAPSREICRFCNIGPRDCPERAMAPAAVSVADF